MEPKLKSQKSYISYLIYKAKIALATLARAHVVKIN